MSQKSTGRPAPAEWIPNVSPLDVQAKPYLSVEEATILIGLSQWSIRHAIRKGELRAAKIGARVVIDKRDLTAFIEEKKQGVALGPWPSVAKRGAKAAKA